jgi:hypothetical protein
LATATTATTTASTTTATTAKSATAGSAAAAGSSTTTAATFCSRPRFVDAQCPPMNILPVQTGNSRLGFGINCHLHKSETTMLACKLILNDGNGRNRTEGLEELLQIFFPDIERQISHVDIHFVLLRQRARRPELKWHQ